MLRPTSRGFTLIELMVVMVITLIIMGMLSSILISTTKVVRVVELKLRLVEQARGILDTFEQQIINTCPNERGGQFVIKGAEYTDNDPDKNVSNNLNPTASIRKNDALFFSQVAHRTGIIGMPNYPNSGGHPFPMFQSTNSGQEYAVNAFISRIHYGAYRNNTSSDYYTMRRWYMNFDLNTIRNDSSRMTYGLAKYRVAGNAWKYRNYPPPTPVNVTYIGPVDAVPHQLEPGQEIFGPYIGSNVLGSTAGNISNFDDIHLMDVSFAAWDETDRKFHRVPHLHAVYFAPVPKAVLVSITVCDINKKGRISFSRIIRPPTGMGSGHFDPVVGNADTGTIAKTLAAKILAKNPLEILLVAPLDGVSQFKASADANNNHKLDTDETVTSLLSLPMPYNRLKLLRTNANVAGADDYDPNFIDTSVFK